VNFYKFRYTQDTKLVILHTDLIYFINKKCLTSKKIQYKFVYVIFVIKYYLFIKLLMEYLKKGRPCKKYKKDLQSRFYLKRRGQKYLL